MIYHIHAIRQADCPHTTHPCYELFHTTRSLGLARWETRDALYHLVWRIGPPGLYCIRPSIEALKEVAADYVRLCDLQRRGATIPHASTMARENL